MKRSLQIIFGLILAVIISKVFMACERESVESSHQPVSCVSPNDCDGDGHAQVVDCNDHNPLIFSGAIVGGTISQ